MSQMQKKFDVSDEDINKLMNIFKDINPCNIWSQVKQNDFKCRRFAMGFVNDIICCELTKEAKDRLCQTPVDCSGIVVKFVFNATFFRLSPIENCATNMIVSDNKLGPRLVYISEECLIHEYIQGRNYNYEDDLDPKTVKQLARVLGRFHSLQTPLSIKGFNEWNALVGNLDEDRVPNMSSILNKTFLDTIAKDPSRKAKYYDALSEVDFRQSFEYCATITKAINSPLVFSHSDFNRGNRLVKEVNNDDGTISKEIYLVDLDYSTYNHRGIDLGRYFSNYRHQDDMFGDEGFPTDQEMALFLNEYRQECAKQLGIQYLEQKENSLENLIKETKVFTLNAYHIDYFFSLMMYVNDPDSPKADYFLKSFYDRYMGFTKLKKRFEQDGAIPLVNAN